ncbi:MAG: hypothetical protein K2X32_12950 [Phycisphaerales bacterium]|nr:hypothetical protein [Phycisphaerales bacterium]
MPQVPQVPQVPKVPWVLVSSPVLARRGESLASTGFPSRARGLRSVRSVQCASESRRALVPVFGLARPRAMGRRCVQIRSRALA